MWENLFVLGVLGASGSYIVRRLLRMSQSYKNKQAACGSCASGTCSPASPDSTSVTESLSAGETLLRVKS